MSKLFTHIQPDHDGEAGIHESEFSIAVQVWSFMQNRRTSVAEVALAFNTTPELVRRAVSEHTWTFLEGPDDDPAKQFIWHEGE